MHPLIEKLIKSGPVVTDGAWGTQLQKRGLRRGECPDSWNLTNPAKVEEVARLYVDSGSRIILTNTFGSNRFVLGKMGLDDKAREINLAGARISRRAAGKDCLVFASIGPSGKMLMMGDVTGEELAGAFKEQADALAEGGADGIVIETMMDINEAKIAAAAARTTGLPVIVSMVYDSGKNKDRTMMGNTIAEVIEGIVPLGVDAVGANCGQGIEGFIPLCARMRELTDIPLWIKPNAGLPEMKDGEVVYTTGPREFVKHVPGLLSAGANFIGGCCGTDGAFIRAIAEIVR